jgi:hypothetical protein
MQDPNSKSLLESTRQTMTTWSPQRVAPPQIDPHLDDMNILQRTAEILRYRLMALEYTLSPCGALRAFLKLCVALGLLLSIPALLIVPVLIVLFQGLADLAAAIAAICMGILQAILAVFGIVVAGGMLAAFCRRR